VKTTFYRDADADGYGTDKVTTEACEPPNGFASLVGDCNDANSLVNPAATEIVNNDVDENCDGEAEHEAILTCFLRHPDGLTHDYYILGKDVDHESANPVEWGDFLGNSVDTHDVHWATFSVYIKEGSRFEWNAATDPENYNPNSNEFWQFSAISATEQYGAPVHQMNTYCYVEIDDVVTWTVPPYAKDNGGGWYNLEVRAEPSHLITSSDVDGDGYTVADGDCYNSDPRVRPNAVEIWGDGEDQDCNGKDPYATVIITLCGPSEHVHPKPTLWEVAPKWQPHTLGWNNSCFEESFTGYYAPQEFYFEWGSPTEWDNSYWGNTCHELTNVSARGYGYGQSTATDIPVSLSKVPTQDSCHRYIDEDQLNL